MRKIIRKNTSMLFIKIISLNSNSQIKIKGVPTFKTKIGNINYQVNGAIVFDRYSKNYSCIIKNNKSWSHVQDDKVKDISWPRNSKDVVIFILQDNKK